jgi:spore maturation protein CgeB
MLVDLKIKVKLKYIVPKEKQLLINNFDSYGEMEVDVPVKDLKEKIDHYLVNNEERELIRIAGHERSKLEHTYKHRWATILGELGL